MKNLRILRLTPVNVGNACTADQLKLISVKIVLIIMAGLFLIQEYWTDTDEESDNSNDENAAILNIENKSSKLPLPQSVLSCKEVAHHEEIIDDPSQHDGRTRSFKHERGNWATLVYIDYVASDEMLQWMKSISKEVEKSNLFEDFHISLTRTLILKFHWIDSFVETVKSIVDGYTKFRLELGNIKVYCNEDNTRTFVGITVLSSCNSLKSLTLALDKLADEYQLPAFYEDASYHISFLWSLGDQRKKLEPLISSLNSSLYNFLVEYPDQRYVQINQIKCKIGNKLYNINLR